MSSQEDQYSEARSSGVDNPQETQEVVPEETHEEVSEETHEEVSEESETQEEVSEEEDDQEDDNTQNASMDQGTQELLGDDVIQAIDLISKKGLKIGIRAMKHLQKRLKNRYPSSLDDDEMEEGMENMAVEDEALGEEEFEQVMENAVSRVSTTKRTKEEEWRKLIVSLLST